MPNITKPKKNHIKYYKPPGVIKDVPPAKLEKPKKKYY